MCCVLSNLWKTDGQVKALDFYMATKSNVTMSEMITKNHALVAEFGNSLDRLLDGIETSWQTAVRHWAVNVS